MDNSGEVADLMVKESIQLTEAAVKMLAAGSKNLAGFPPLPGPSGSGT